MRKEWEGDVEEYSVLRRGLIWSGFLHYRMKQGEDGPHHLRLSLGESEVVGLIHG